MEGNKDDSGTIVASVDSSRENESPIYLRKEDILL